MTEDSKSAVQEKSLRRGLKKGQVQMVAEVSTTFESGEHLLVQAGTGTGKSLGYLAPALAKLAGDPQARIVIATATLALQTQLANKDIPTAVDACEQVTGRRITHAVLKGRSNYVCLQRVRDGQGVEQEALVADPSETSGLGAEVVALRRWAEEQADDEGLADRDDAPDHTPAAWAQVSVPVRECLGAQKCPFGEVCFVEESRRRARARSRSGANCSLSARTSWKWPRPSISGFSPATRCACATAISSPAPVA